jgi:flagellar P-ring protein precursor FlgI
MAVLILVGVLLQGVWLCTAEAARIKDIAAFVGARTNPLLGYGLVVGLNGTGDNTKTQFTVNTLANLLDNLGIHVDPTSVKVKNVAAVMVTAKLPPFARPGSRVDVEVSSIGDAKSLEGGNLLMTPLQGPDGSVYAVAQGPVSTGGFSVSGGSGSSVQKNINTTALISGGAMVEKEVPVDYSNMQQLDLVLRTPDFTTASKAASRINEALGSGCAQAMDAATIRLQVLPQYQSRIIDMMTQVEGLEVPTDVVAKIIINERTGTVVIGENVRISPVAVAHGSLTVQISEQPQVSQPLPFSQGQTAVVPQTSIQVQEPKASLSLLEGGATIGQVIQGLNAIGATPKDLISILQAIKAAGALQAELEII